MFTDPTAIADPAAAAGQPAGDPSLATLEHRTPAASPDRLGPAPTADAVFDDHRQRVFRQTDRLFAGLMVIQWLAGILLAVALSPRTWDGPVSAWHPHLWAALFLGATTNLVPAAVAAVRPGRLATRLVVSAGQAGTSALLIHLTGGRIETHFHIFVSLAFLSLYRDWRALVPATAVTAVDHLFRGIYLPADVYGSAGFDVGRWLEHVAWVVFEDVVLIGACVRGTREMRQIATRTAESLRHLAELAATRETAADAIVATDAGGRVTAFNAAAERAFGVAREAAVGRPVADVILPAAARGAHRDGLAGFLLGGGEGPAVARRVEVRAARADGSEFPAELSVSTVALGGQPTFVAYVRDITDRQAAEAQARHAAKLALVAARTTNAVIITDPAGRIEWVNDGFTRVTGYRIDEVLGRKPGSFLQGPETDPATVAAMGASLARGDGFRVEVVNYGKAGTPYWLAIEAQPVHGADGAVAHFMAIETDVSERKRIERELRDTQAQFELAVRGSNDGLWDWDVAGGPIYFSPRWLEQVGYAEGELPGTMASFRDLVHPDDYPGVRAAAAASHRDRTKEYAVEFRMRHRDGSWRWILSRGATVWDAAGRPVRMAGSHTDVTARRAAEDDLRRAMADAEAARAQAEQARGQAEQARAEAVRASDAKSQFLANMSHEIRTPLNGVIGMAELLVRRGGLTDQQGRYARVIQSSADTLLALINDVLDFSKIEAGKLELSCLDADVRAVAEDVVQMLAPKASAKGLEFACRVGPEVPALVSADPDRLRQILTNLANNAIKFTDRGEVVIRVSAEPDAPAAAAAVASGAVPDDNGRTLRFAVVDTGVGIPPDRMDRLFKSFSQVDASTTRKYGGTGLGLAIAKQLAELMGGAMGVESAAGHGSTFWFTARVRPAAGVPVAGGGAARPAAAGEARTVVRGTRVLAVDDNPAYREILREQFLGWGFAPTVAATGEEGLERLRAAAADGVPYHLAVVDMLMPGMNGAEMARAAKADPALAGTAMIMLTSLDDPLDPAQLRAAGFAASLTKPVRHSQLFDAVMDALAGRAQPTGGPAKPAAAAGAATRAASLAGVRVLLAEDNEVNQEVARDLLADFGCAVEVVGNGRLAVREAGRGRFDVVLMDCQMPEMDGFEAAGEIRRLERGGPGLAPGGGRLPIVALTANAIEGDRQRCLAAGMDGYVTKPVDPDLLERAIREAVGGRRPATASPVAASSAAPPPVPPPAVTAVGASPPVVPLDVPSLLKRCRGKASLAEKLLAKFQEQLPQQMADIRRTLAEGDLETLTRLAHTVKGSAANMSADPLRFAAAELEQLAVARDVAAVGDRLAAFAAEIDRTLAYLPAAVGQFPAAAAAAAAPAERPAA